MIKIVIKKCLVLSLAAMFVLTAFAADDTKGFLRGRATGSDSAALIGITITITELSKQNTRTTTTNENGDYRFAALNTGNYSITATNASGSVLAKHDSLYIGIGAKSVYNIDLSSTLEIVAVHGSVMVQDTSSAVKDFVVNTDELLARVPVARDITSVALLAPSAHEADQTFSVNNHDPSSISLGGSSVGENACFINGLNTTNFRNGLGCSQLPFEFYEQIQIKNGGYNGEFGRSIGGVLNATTKSGGNELKGGISAYWKPDELRGHTPSTYASDNSQLKHEERNYNLWLSGPIVEDKLFFYALYSPNKKSSTYERFGQLNEATWNDEFWGLKLDYIISENHTLEYTGFDDTRVEIENNYKYDKGKGDKVGVTTYSRGGLNHALKYTGIFTDWMTINTQYGINQYRRTDSSTTDASPAIYDRRGSATKILGPWTNLIPTEGYDERKAFRLDIDLFLGNHNVRVGFDHELNTAEDSHYYSGHIRYDYYSIPDEPTDPLHKYVANGKLNLGDDYVRVRKLESSGKFETETTALYIQDEWQINDSLTLHVGIRNEAFDNRNSKDETFIEIDEQWAPRLGLSFDPHADGQSRIYANYGRYFLPIAANTNIRMAGNEFFTEEYYQLIGVNADGTPQYTSARELIDSSVLADGTIPDVREILDKSIDPMYQDEFILGYDITVSENWNLGVRMVYRDLKSTIEDIAVDAALNKYVLANYGIEKFAKGFDFYVLTNPGSDLEFSTDINGDGILDPISLSAQSLGYPEATRTYKAIEFTFERMWDEQWMLGGSVVIAKTEGNHEGYVKSDNGQDDAGLTTSFDQPGLTDGANGYLPNDRRWTLKIWGSYQLNNGLLLGSNFTARDGRPVNCIGNHPTDTFAAKYGAESFYCQGQLKPRGSAGRTADVFKLDLSAQYTIELDANSVGESLVLRANIFNVFDWDKEVEVVEHGELNGGRRNVNYKKPSYYQSPRTVQFSVNYNF